MTDTISSDDHAPWPEVDRPSYGGFLRRLGGATQTTAMTAAVSLVLLGGVATVTVRSLAPEADPAQVVPASAFAIAEFDLSLPDGQDAALAHLIDRFPGALKKGSGSVRDRLLDQLFASSSQPHVDYRKAIKPWLGDHVAFAGWVDDSGTPQAEVVLESTDDGAARKALRNASPDGGIAFSHGFAVFAPSQQIADAAVRAANKSSLAGSRAFSGDVAALAGSPIATGWVDGPAAVTALAHALSGKAGGLDFLSKSGLEDTATGRITAGLRVRDDGDNSAVQLDVVTRGTKASSRSTSTDRLLHLPSTTFAAAAVADPAGVVRDAANAIKGPLSLFFAGSSESCSTSSDNPVPQCTSTGGGDLPDPLTQLSTQIGIQIPDDLVSLLGSDAVVAYGGLAGGGVPKIGIRSKPADLNEAANVVTKLRTSLGNSGSGIDLAERVDGGDFVVATTDGYAGDLAKSGTLGTVDRFADAMRGMPSSVQFATYVDLGALLPLTTHGTVPQLDHLTALGMWTATVNGDSTTQVRLIVH
jgi:hypothetical protein